MNYRSLAVICAIVATALMSLAATASAGEWRVISMPFPGSNTDAASAVRGADGKLHVTYPEDGGDRTRIGYRTITLAGEIRAAQAVVAGWSSHNNPDVELIGTVPHVFWGGLGTTSTSDPTSTGAAWFATFRKGVWTPSTTPATTATTPYASTVVSSTIDSAGRPWFAWTQTSVLGVHRGLDATGFETNLSAGCCEYAPNMARDAATGDVYLIYFSNVTGSTGMYSRRIAPVLGDAQRIAGVQAADEPSLSRVQRLAAAPRTTGGVYTAFCDAYPSCDELRVAAETGSSLSLPLSEPANPDTVWAANAPDGRMWVSWADKDDVWARRSNRALTQWGPAQRLGAPRATTSIWNTSGEGSRGFLDLFAVVTNTRTNVWHQRVQPPLTITRFPASTVSSRGTNVTFTVADAGDRVPSAVRFRGTTRAVNALGRATFYIPAGTAPGQYVAVARAPGYVNATTPVVVTRGS